MNTGNTDVLAVRGVTKTYGTFTAVSDLTFEVHPGEVFGFLGPNGAGKTTTLRMILDIIRPTSGTITVLGADSALKVRPRIGYLPEERGLYKKMTAARTIAYFGQLKGLGASEARKRAHALLERFGLKEFARSKVEALSKGMAQKVQLLCAIVHDPELVILDEPFSGLDPVNQQVLEDLIRELADDRRTILFSTHVMQHAERLCDRLLLVAGGRERFQGSLAQARSAIPRRVRIETPDPVEGLAGLPAVSDIHAIAPEPNEAPGAPRYDVVIHQGADPQTILKSCFDWGIVLRQFDQSEPSLHEVFVELVGDDAREVALR